MSKSKHKEIFYTDEYGNKIDINSREGISAILNDLFSACITENQCVCTYENMKDLLEKARKNKMLKIMDRRDKDYGQFNENV